MAYTEWADITHVCAVNKMYIFEEKKQPHTRYTFGKNRGLDVQLQIAERKDSESVTGNFASLAAWWWRCRWGVEGECYSPPMKQKKKNPTKPVK